MIIRTSSHIRWLLRMDDTPLNHHSISLHPCLHPETWDAMLSLVDARALKNLPLSLQTLEPPLNPISLQNSTFRTH